MAKVKMLTSANRDGVALPNGSLHEFPVEDAVSLCKAGLAAPEDFTLVDGAYKPHEPPAPPSPPEDTAGDDRKTKPKK